METLLKSKALWQFMKTAMPDPKDDQHQFVFEKKKDEDVGFITTYILSLIHI